MVLTTILVVLALPVAVLACRDLLAHRPRRELSSTFVAPADIASGIAAVAALLTVYYARATVSEARRSRNEASSAHTDEMNRAAQLLQATITAHEREMAERAEALARELWLQRLTQLGKVQELLGDAVEAARSEIGRREAGSPMIASIGSTLLSSALLRVEAAVVILTRLGGPALPDIRQMTEKGRDAGASLYEVEAEAVRAIAATRFLAETDDKFRRPDEPGL
jgi:hypothetical protein